MRLLYLNPTASMGGAERVLVDVLATVRATQPAWALGLIVGNEGTLAEEARRLGVQTTVLPFPREFARIGDAGLKGPGAWFTFVRHALVGGVAMVGYMRRLARAVRHFAPDVMHSNGFKMHLLSALAKPDQSALVWHFHDYLSSRRIASRLIRRLRTRCDAIIAVSESVAADIRGVLGSSPPVHTIWNAVDLTRFAPDGPSADLDRLSGLPAAAGMVRVGLVATFARWKGHMLFLNVMRALATRHDVRGYIVGGPLYETDGSQYSIDELRSAIRRFGLEHTVGLTGFIRDSATALRELDVVVHASTSPEPFGLVMAEAMAAGRAVVVSQTGGVAEIVKAETNALSYPQGDEQALTRQVERLVADVGLRRRLGNEAHRAAVAQFDPARVGRQLIGVYSTFQVSAA